MKKLLLVISLITIGLGGCYVRGHDEGHHRDRDHHKHDKDHHRHDRGHDRHDGDRG